MHSVVFLGDPMPGIRTSENQSGDQKHERPGAASRMAPVQPEAKHRTKERRDRDGPTDQSGHAKTKPDTVLPLALHLELAGDLRGYLPEKDRLLFRGPIYQLIAHVETPRNG